jgi:hypothetical protein
MTHTPLTITRKNCMECTGMAWPRVLRFAREHGVPVFTLSERTTAVHGAAFVAALERAGCVAAARQPDALDLLLAGK